MGTGGLGDKECSGLRQNSPYTLQEVTDKPKGHQGRKGIHCRDRTKHLSSQVRTMPDHQPPTLQNQCPRAESHVCEAQHGEPGTIM